MLVRNGYEDFGGGIKSAANKEKGGGIMRILTGRK